MGETHSPLAHGGLHTAKIYTVELKLFKLQLFQHFN